MSGIVVDVIQGTPEWHQFRMKGIGGSDSPVVEEISPYKTLRQLFFEKTGKPVESDEDANEFIFARGHKVEGLIRKEFQALVRAEMSPVCMIHPKFDHVRASLDGFSSALGVLEAKLVGQETLGEARQGNLPEHHYSQMQHQFAVTGADVGRWFGHDGKKNGVLLEVRANPQYIDRLLEREHKFWDDVKTGRVPPLSERDYLEPEDTKLLKDLRDAKELAENAAAQYEAVKTHVINVYGGHPKISGAGVKLFKVARQGVLNVLKIPEVASAAEDAKAKLTPEYIESFRGQSSESWTIRINSKG